MGMAKNPLNKLAQHIRRLYPKRQLVELAASVDSTTDFSAYYEKPVEFAAEILGAFFTPDQSEIARSVATHGRVKINSGHNLGKSYLCACLAIWWYCTRNPGVIITTAPTERDVVDILWTEIRLLVRNAIVPLNIKFAGPKSAEIFDTNDHWAKGYTSRAGESFQGRHRSNMLFLFDECEGIPPIYWQVTDTMFQLARGHAWIAIGNPVGTSSQSYIEDTALKQDGTPKWRVFTLSGLNHPNIAAELAGQPPPVPNAIDLSQIDQMVMDMCDQLRPGDVPSGNDFEWRPGSGRWFRPGPAFMARVMGKRPTSGVDSVWSLESWNECLVPRYDPKHCWLMMYGITIGVDVAVYGDDMTTFHVRTGPLSIYHESRNGWGPNRITGRIKELCSEWSGWYNSLASEDKPPITPADVNVIVELDGLGQTVFETFNNFGNWCGFNVAEQSNNMDAVGRPRYANKRAEIWFVGAERAKSGRIDLSRLPGDVRERMGSQLLTPSYRLMPNGARCVEDKKDVKKRLRRSPDDADGLLIAYAEVPMWRPEVIRREI